MITEDAVTEAVRAVQICLDPSQEAQFEVGVRRLGAAVAFHYGRKTEVPYESLQSCRESYERWTQVHETQQKLMENRRAQ